MNFDRTRRKTRPENKFLVKALTGLKQEFVKLPPVEKLSEFFSELDRVTAQHSIAVASDDDATIVVLEEQQKMLKGQIEDLLSAKKKAQKIKATARQLGKHKNQRRAASNLGLWRWCQ